MSHHRYWCPTNSYIEQLEDAIFQAIEPIQDVIRKDQLICIESDKALALRIASPLFRSRLNILLRELDKTIVFVTRSPQAFTIAKKLWKTVPLMVIYPSECYFKLMTNSLHLKYSKKPNMNLAESALHRYKYQPINWEVINRHDLFGIVLLSGDGAPLNVKISPVLHVLSLSPPKPFSQTHVHIYLHFRSLM